MTIQSITVSKKGGEEKPPVVPVKFTKVLELSALKDGKDFHTLLEQLVGKSQAFWSSKDSRYLKVDPVLCLPMGPTAVDSDEALSVLIDDKVIMFTLLHSTDSQVKVGIFGTTKRTIFIIGRPTGGYFFTFDQSSVSAKEAATNLFVNNLNKGYTIYNRTMAAAPGFFKGLFECVIEDLTVYPFTIRHNSGIHITARLYLDPKSPEKSMLSVCGMVFGINLDEFPSSQISRGYYNHPKEV